jgi:hypothetical protein
MPFPNLEGKHAGRPYVTARRLLEYHDSLGTPVFAMPRAVVLTWQGRLERLVRERRQHQEIHGAAIGSSVLLRLTPDLGLARLPIGAPAAAIAVEELSARGRSCSSASAPSGRSTSGWPRATWWSARQRCGTRGPRITTRRRSRSRSPTRA